MMAAVLALALTASAAGVVVAGRWLNRAWNGTPFPVADPAATAQRLDGHTQDVYDALGLQRAELDDRWPGGGVSADPYNSDCLPRGLRNFGSGLSDSPTPEPRTTAVYENWALKGVSRQHAVEALGHARKALTARGWRVTSYENSRYDLRLSLTPRGTSDTVSITAYPAHRLQVAAGAPCARYPSKTPLDTGEQPEVPQAQSPRQLRH